MSSMDIELSMIVGHPANPRRELGDLSELVESIREGGIEQPPVVLEAERVAAAWPEHAVKLAGARYVVMLGHRRIAAARVVYGAQGVVLVQLRTDDRADDRLGQLGSMLRENISREDLSPMEEARGFALYRDEGLSERKIAAVTGASQSRVHKRLELLKLPAGAAAAIDAGAVEIQHGLALAKLDDDDRAAAWELYAAAHAARAEVPADDDAAGENLRASRYASEDDDEDEHGPVTVVAAIRAQEEVRAAEARLAESLALAEKEGVEVVDAAALWGDKRYDHGISAWATDALAAAREAGRLRCAPNGHGGLSFYSTEPHPQRSTGGDSQKVAKDREKARKAAVAARDAACATLARQAPGWERTPVNELMVANATGSIGADAAKLVQRWLADHPAGSLPASLSPEQYRRRLQSAPWAMRCQAAHAGAVARAEMWARDQHRTSWAAFDMLLIRQLVAHAGHQLHPWEAERVDVYEAREALVAAGPYLLHHDGAMWTVERGDGSAVDSTDEYADDAPNATAWARRALTRLHLEVIDWDATTTAAGAACWRARLVGEAPADEVAIDAADALPAFELRYSEDDDEWVVNKLFPTGPVYLGGTDEPAADNPAGAKAFAATLILYEYSLTVTRWTEVTDGVTTHYEPELSPEDEDEDDDDDQ